MMMLTQYFDMLKDVGTHGGNSSVFIPHRCVCLDLPVMAYLQ